MRRKEADAISQRAHVFAVLALFVFAQAGFPVQSPVTVFEDDTSTGTHLKTALVSLGVDHDYTDDVATFEASLADPAYRVAIVNDANTAIDAALDELTTFFDNGGVLLLFVHNIGGESSHPLWGRLGALWQEDLSDPPAAFALLNAGHPIFTTPNSVGSITVSNTDAFGDNGDHVSALAVSEALAKSSGGDSTDLLIVARSDGRAVLNSFLPGNYIGDDDFGDLLENEILFVTNNVFRDGFELQPTPFWSSISPQLCQNCGEAQQPSGCYCNADCLLLEDCCIDACLVCGRCP
jgi:hypothetical protein